MKYGYVFLNCTLSHSSDATKVYLGRPWRIYAKTVFVNCELGSHILAEGWHNWNKAEAEKSTFYAEYKSRGEGANPTKRVLWSHQLSAKESRMYNVKEVLRGDDEWNPIVW